MRLLDTSSYELTEFVGKKIPPYAILSHTWGEGEVLFHDIQNGTAQSKKGFGKLVGCCKKAAEDGFKWVWIDTCCIDKTSSAELSEAINSMYQWYKDSVVCYAYLEDVTEVLPTPGMKSNYFTESRWFTRGWTLQELIAPDTVEFYTVHWEEIGTKTSFAAQIKTLTGIPTQILHGKNVLLCNVAQRVSWASQRQTTRPEDMAYCLMGLFQINMPLLYGEGEKAFVRLQEQILRQEEDYTIFAWTLQEQEEDFSILACKPPPGGEVLTGCLATSPSQFANLDPLERMMHPGVFYDSHTCRVMTNKNYEFYQKLKGRGIRLPPNPPELTARGIRITFPVRPARGFGEPAMACIHHEVDDRLVCVVLCPIEIGGATVLARWSTCLISVDKSLWPEFELSEVFLIPHGNVRQSRRLTSRNIVPTLNVRLELTPAVGYSAHIVSILPSGWRYNGFSYIDLSFDHGLGVIECANEGQDAVARFLISCGVLGGNPWCSVEEESGPEMRGEAEDRVKLFREQTAALQEPGRLRRVYEDGSLTISDRAAKPSFGIPGMVVSVTTRRRLGDKTEAAAQLILRVTVGELASCDGWAQVYARQEIARLEGKAGTRP